MAYEDEVLADSPAVYYRLGDTSGTTAVDATGTVNGTYEGTFTLNQTSLIASDPGNASATFVTDGDVLIAANAVHNITGDLTLEAWINADTFPAAENFVVGKWNGGSERYWISVVNDGRFFAQIGDSGGSTTFETSTGVIATANTYHLVMTYSDANNRIRLYVDGDLSAQNTSFTQALGALNHSLYIAQRNGAGLDFDGRIDEVAVYASELTAARILAHYDAAFATGGGLAWIRA